MVLRSVSLRRGIRARRFTIRDHDQVLMVVPFDRLPTSIPVHAPGLSGRD